MKLYYSPGAASLAVHIALRELAVDVQLERVDLAQKRLAHGGGYLLVSPLGYVPLLELPDGSRHTETAALLQWIAEHDREQRLIGKIDSNRRMEVLRWLVFVATELHKNFSPWLWQPRVAESTRQQVWDTLQAKFTEVEAVLRRRVYLAEAFSVADAYAYAVLSWAVYLKLPLDGYPAIRSYLKRVAQRPAVIMALREEGLKP